MYTLSAFAVLDSCFFVLLEGSFCLELWATIMSPDLDTVWLSRLMNTVNACSFAIILYEITRPNVFFAQPCSPFVMKSPERCKGWSGRHLPSLKAKASSTSTSVLRAVHLDVEVQPAVGCTLASLHHGREDSLEQHTRHWLAAFGEEGYYLPAPALIQWTNCTILHFAGYLSLCYLLCLVFF